MWELDCEESWAPKNWCFWSVVLEKTLERPLDCKEIQPVHSKGNQSWVFIGRTDAKAETPILWPPPAKSWLIGKDSDAGRDWGQEEKGMTEDEMAGWHHRLSGHEFEWTPGVGDGQGVLACCNSWGRKESDTTERLNWTEVSEASAENSEAKVSSYLNKRSKAYISWCSLWTSLKKAKLGRSSRSDRSLIDDLKGLVKSRKRDIIKIIGTFLMVRWLRDNTPNAGDRLQSLVRELDLTCHTESSHATQPNKYFLKDVRWCYGRKNGISKKKN